MNSKKNNYDSSTNLLSDTDIVILIDKSLGWYERDYWIDLLPALSDWHKHRLIEILNTIENKLQKLNEKVLIKFGDE